MLEGILVTGGAGYIGSHVVKTLIDANAKNVVVLDNLSTGFRDALTTSKFIQGDIRDIPLLLNILETEKINTVIHLAASTIISESLENPCKYYQNNTVGTLNLLEACIQKKIKYFIYSSTAAVYGKVNNQNIHELDPTVPLNPYGHSKLMSEQILQDVARRHRLQYIILRYFNVAGADPSGKIGQRTPNATHLIKVAAQTACGLRTELPIYGTQYPTPDGTCIRDYIHVSDLAIAHMQALLYLQEGGESATINCGYGHGFSVKEVIRAVETIHGQTLPVCFSPEREGDLPRVVADNAKMKKILHWKPQFASLDLIVKTALDWEKQLQVQHL